MSAQQIVSLIEAHTHGLATVSPVAESLEVRLYGWKMERQAAFNAALGLRVA
jgi:hypothetical protein